MPADDDLDRSPASTHPVQQLLSQPDDARHLGPYRLKRQLGRGGFAPVWLAEEVCGDTTLRLAAVKLFALDASIELGAESSEAGTPQRRAHQGIIDEALRLCQVEHPNIVRFYALPMDESRGVVGLAMEYVAGEALNERLARLARLPPHEALDLGASVASALAAVHAKGIVHRDVSPANIVVNAGASLGAAGAYKLIDFGISAAQPAARRRAIMGGASANVSLGRGAAAAERAAREAIRGDLPIDLVGMKLADLPTAMRLPEPAVQNLISPLTAVGGKLGYVDPVCWRDFSPATMASDLYGLGAVLFVCLTGRIPAAGTGALRGDVLSGEARPPRVSEIEPAAPPRLAELIDALLDPDPARRPQSAEIVAIEFERLRAQQSGRKLSLPPEEEGPFRGLNRFEREHRDIFFGRRGEIAATVEAMRTRGLVALVGPSGSGKSSLARAGVVPAVLDGALGGPKKWDAVMVTPGADPRHAILAGLFHMLPEAQRTPAETALAIVEWLNKAQQGLLLLVDQLEEIATLANKSDRYDESRRWAIELLSRLGERPLPNLRVLVTARRDMLDSILAHTDLGRVMMRGAVLVTPIGDAAWGDVIDAALETYGYTFEGAALRTQLLEELRGKAGAMPLVEFAMMRLWSERDPEKKQITRAGMREVGGVAGALDRYAEATLARAELDGIDAATIRRLFLALTTPEGTRATRTVEALAKADGGDAAQVQAAVLHFEAARLLVRERDGVTVAHEALLTQWGRLRTWLAEVRHDRLFAGEIERAARAWANELLDPDLLWRGRRLTAAAEIRRRGGVALSPRALHFMRASDAGRIRRRLAAVATAVVLALSAAVFATKYVRDLHAAQERIQAEKERAERSEREALAQKERAERATQEAIQAKKEADEAAYRYYSALGDFAQRFVGAEDPKELVELQAQVRAQQEAKEVPPAELPELLSEGALPEGDAGDDLELPAPEEVFDEPPPALPASFDRGAAYAALQDAALQAAACSNADGPHGIVKVQVLFDPEGHVASVATAKLLRDTVVGQCVERAFLGIRVPSFTGSAVAAPKTFKLP